jgi:penicillin-binding protein 2
MAHFDLNRLEGNIEKTINKKTGIWFFAFVVTICLVFLVRLWNLEISDGQKYSLKSELNRLRHVKIFAVRGNIMDRNGKILVHNEQNEGNSNEFLKRKYENITGINNFIGFVKYPQKDTSGFYYETEVRGMDGLEKIYNDVLSGVDGLKIIEVDAFNKIVSEGTFMPPKQGESIKISLDLDLSKAFYGFIESVAKERGFLGGAGALMDIETGELITLASYPEYDSQILTDGKDNQIIKSYDTNKGKPYLNKVAKGLYTPGSIVKPFVAIGVLNEKIIDPKTQILSTGSISIQNEYDPEKKSVFNDWKAHGLVDMRRAIAVSSNVYFYEVGGGYEKQQGLGISRIESYLKMFGFGKTVDSPFFYGEVGTIPSPDWKEINFPNDPWRIGDTYNTAIGQYGLQVTPIQVVRAMSAIAGDGRLVEPTIIFQDGTSPISSTQTGISKEYFKIVKEGMRDGVLSGSASGLNILNIAQVEVAAKTGTAQVGISKKFVNSWVTGFFPYQNPRYAFVVMMEHGSSENTVGALYVMRQFLEWLHVYHPEYLKNN